jgi:maltooligosyltrehalose trehalohydrolase
MSATVFSKNLNAFAWTDLTYRTAELQDLIVYELQVEEFNDSFDGVVDRLDYLASLGVNCLELMPVTSSKLDFDWGYGPVYHFSPSAHFGGPDGLRRLVDAAHARGIAVILDVVYEHVDPSFAYYGVYNDIANTAGAPHPASPLTKGSNVWGFGPACDFTQQFCRDFFLSANQMWLDEYHVDGFRHDEVTDLYVGARAAGYQELVERVYGHSLGIARFEQGANSYSRIIQCAEALGISRPVMKETYSNAAFTDDLLNKVEDMMRSNYVDDNFAHILDPVFSGYPSTQTVINAANQPVERPVAPFQLRQMFIEAGVTGKKKAITYCEVGLQASYVYFLARYLGIDSAMYDGSYREWSEAKQPEIRGTLPGSRELEVPVDPVRPRSLQRNQTPVEPFSSTGVTFKQL